MDTNFTEKKETAFSAAVLVVFGLLVALTPFIRLAAEKNALPTETALLPSAPSSSTVEIDLAAPPPADSAPAVYAEGAVLIDGNSLEILYSHNCSRRLPMASTTKIMTALVAAETLSPDEYVKVPQAAAGIEGSSIYLEANETVSVKTLLYGLMLESGNDAATVLALASCGSVEAFAEKMNERAASLGLTSTHFTNPHGLPDDDHYTTAYELAVIASAALKNKVVAEAVSTINAVTGGEDGEKRRYMTNHNKMLRLYDGACGVKTGFTKAAGRCLVSAAERDGTLLIAATLGCLDDWDVHVSLLDYGFANYKSILILPPGGIDLSPFGVKCDAQAEIWRTFPKNASAYLSYRLHRENGEVSLIVSEEQQKNPGGSR